MKLKIGFLHNIFRLNEGHPCLELLFQVVRNMFGQKREVELINFADKYSSRISLFNNDVLIPAIDEWAVFQETLPIGILSKEIFDVDLLIGYELSPGICSELTIKNTPYLNFFTSPIRFLPDLIWHITTNNDELAQILQRWELRLSEATKYADEMRIKTVRQQLSLRPFIKDGSAVIAGQMCEDSSVLSDGTFHSLEEYAEKIKVHTEDCSGLIIVKHPYEDNIFPLRILLNKLGRGFVCNFNMYTLLCSDRVKKVITLSSSVGCEAPYFGKESFFLLGKALRPGGSVVEKGAKGYEIGAAVFNKGFWESLFSYRIDNKWRFESYKAGIAYSQDYLREILGARWALEKEQSIETNRLFMLGDFEEAEKYELSAKGVSVIDSKYREIVFSNKSHLNRYQEKGLSGIEDGGRWSKRKNVEIKIVGAIIKGGLIEIELMPYISELVAKQRVKIFINEEFVLSRSLEQSEDNLIRIKLNDKTRNNYVLTFNFELADAVSPASLGLNSDIRELGVMFKKMRFLEEHL